MNVVIKWQKYHTVSTVLKYHTVSTVLKYHTVSTFLKYHTVSTVLKYHTVSTVLKYHTVTTVLKYHTVTTVLKYHTVSTLPKSNRKMVEIEIKSRPFNTYTYTWSFAFLAWYRHFIKCGGVKLWVKHPLFSKMVRSCTRFTYMSEIPTVTSYWVSTVNVSEQVLS